MNIKIIGILLIISSVAIPQDKGIFETYSNPFYNKIIQDCNNYEKVKKIESKSFKMNFDGKKNSSEFGEFTIIDVYEPISQGNTGTCWCFSTTSFYESEIKESLEKTLIYQNYTQYILNMLKKQENTSEPEEKHI